MDGMTLEELNVVIAATTRPMREELARAQNDVSKLTKRVNQEVNQIQNAFKQLGRFVAAIGIGKVVKDSVQSAMKVEGALQQIKRIMGESSQMFLKWGKEHGLAYNMAQSDIAKYGSVYSNLLSSFMGGSKQTIQYTQELLKSSSIIASGTGRTMDDVMERIRSGLLGNTEAIEDLGINVNVAMLESTAAFERFANGRSWNQLDFQTQQQIRLFAILEQTSSKFGNEVMNNTNSSLQHLVAILKDVGLNIGNAFLPIMNVVLPILSNFAMGLRTVTGYIAAFMQTLFGKGNKASEGPKIAASTMDKAKSAALGGANAQNGYNKALKKTGDTAKKTAKEVNRLLGGFDEINSIADSGSNGGGLPGAGGGIGGGGISTPSIIPPIIEEPDISGIEIAVEKVKELFKPLKKACDDLWKSVEPVINNVGKILRWFLDEILIPFGKWTISDVLPAFLNILAGVFDILNPILEVFMDLGKWLWDSFLQPIAAWTGGIIVDILNGLANILKDIGAWMKEHKPIIEALVIIIGSFALAWGLVNVAFAIWFGLLNAYNAVVYIATVGTSGLAAAFAALNWPIIIIVAAIGSVIAIGVLLAKHWDEIKAKAIEVWDRIKAKFNEFKEWLSGIFTTDWSKQFGILGSLLNNFLQKVSGIWNSIKQIFKGIIDFVAGVFTGDWKRAWQGVQNIFGGIFNGLKALVKSPLNAVIDLINWAIGGINDALTMKVPDWVPVIGGKGWSVDIPKIPKLARGGIVDSATLAVVGEAGKEAVMPLENNTGWITDLATKVATRMPSNEGNDTSSISGDIIFQIDGAVIGRVALKQLRKMQRQGGITIIPV
ncbi:MAG: hypothetical protein ACRCVJ_13040 [Clostridium sp.]|uniref:hypothetical protein n=1 Tax=Clostridium sp. TaxID=1506 RepID=UPI003F39291D